MADSGNGVSSRHLTQRGPRCLRNATVLKPWQWSGVPGGPSSQWTGAPASDMLVAHVAYSFAPRRIGRSPAESLSPVLIVSRGKESKIAPGADSPII